eukprot:gene28958-37993_t
MDLFELLDVGIVLSHEICNLPATSVHSHLSCMFESSNCNPHNYSPSGIKELFLVREPLSRAISVYYFWGELFKLRASKRQMHGRQMLGDEGNTTAYVDVVIDSDDDFDYAEESQASSSTFFRRQLNLLGQTGSTSPIDGRMFKYHGDENTVPPLDLAMKFALSLPYRAGMPGPSYSWSAFADNVVDALEIIRSDRMVSLVIEKLDESLVAQSSHPKYSQWPEVAVAQLTKQLTSHKEFQIYEAAVEKLASRMEAMKKAGIDLDARIALLRSLRIRVTEICSNKERMNVYRQMLQDQGFTQHPARNKLRDVSNDLANEGHLFSFNKEILGSFDVCGGCEAHALMHSLPNRTSSHPEESPDLSSLFTTLSLKDVLLKEPRLTSENANFRRCPTLADFASTAS